MKMKAPFFIGLMAVSGLFFGCASVLPMKGVVISRMPGGSQVIPAFQYYISRTIILTSLSNSGNSVKRNPGIAKLRIHHIQISKGTPGRAPEIGSFGYSRDGSGRLMIGVSFDKGDPNNKLWFIQDDTNPYSKFHLYWENEAKQEVRYGGNTCRVVWTTAGEDMPLVGVKWKSRRANRGATVRGIKQRTNFPGSSEEPPYLIIRLESKQDLKVEKGRKYN